MCWLCFDWFFTASTSFWCCDCDVMAVSVFFDFFVWCNFTYLPYNNPLMTGCLSVCPQMC